MDKVINALKLAQNQIAPSKDNYDEYEKELWEVYECAIKEYRNGTKGITNIKVNDIPIEEFLDSLEK